MVECLSLLYIIFCLVLMLFNNTKYKPIIKFFLLIPVLFYAFVYKSWLPINWFYFVFSFPIGYICYILSNLITDSKNSNKVFTIFIPWEVSPILRKKTSVYLVRSIFNASIEELVYRGLLFDFFWKMIGSKWIATCIIVVLFASVHFLTYKAVVQKIDILLFSLIITVIYALCLDIYMVIVIHVIRNFLIIMKQLYYETLKLKRITMLIDKIKEKKHEGSVL